MQLHTLTFQAIGPFDGKHTIDFSRLGASGLFLLEGPTGAGKSTIIDAIVFALYGGLAGEEASKQRLHSHHAEVGVEPFVDLTFSTQAGDYRIRRSPAHERPKRNGTGTTSQNETVKLSRLASLDAPDMGEGISTRAQEIGPEIKRLIGLDKQQFLQTVVLPQGEFARFLRSTGEERKDLLRTIFRTDVYEEVTEQLKAMRIAAGRSIDLARARVGEAVAGFKVASHHEFDDEKFGEQDIDALESACEAVAALMAKAAFEARTANSEAKTALKSAQEFHAEQVRVMTLLVKREDLLAHKELVEAGVEPIATVRRRLETAQRAATVSTSIAGMRAARRELEVATVDLELAHRAYGHKAETRTRIELAGERESISTEIHELGSLLKVQFALTSRSEAFASGLLEGKSLYARIAELTKHVAAAPKLIEEHEAERARLLAGAQSLPDAQAKVDRATKSLAAAQAMRAITAQLAKEAALRDDLVARATQANDDVRQLRQRRLDEFAGVLSSRLVPGTPCAVCGSVDHPAPAELKSDHPTDADIETTERKLADLTTAARAAVDDVHAHEQHLARKQEQAEGLDIDSAASSLHHAEEKHARAQEAAGHVPAAEAALIEAKNRLAVDASVLNKTKVDVAGLEAELSNLETAITDDNARISRAIDGRAGTLDELLGALHERRDVIARLTTACDVHATASQALSGRQDEVDGALRSNGFESLESAEGAALDGSEVAALRSQVRQHEAEMTLVSDGLARPDIAALTGDEETDVDAAASTLGACRLGAEDAQALVNVLDARATTTSKALTGLSEALASYASAVAGSGAIVRLAGIADGSHAANTRKVSLGTYVLMRRFDDVVDAANVRYAPMSNGRYQFARIEEKEGKGGGRRTGLALAIQDGETGTQREPRSLSGGETFVASLCLALGLADVVTGEAGGIELGTLFVDEGFGTLDTESLDLVMAALGKISEGGRMIGVVSHVDELKQRIADRIEVRHKTEGASTLTVKAEGETLSC